MKILIQWAKKDPDGWQQIDASQWRNLPKLPIPARGQLGGLNNTLGWIRNVSVQGITAEGFDHVAIEPIIIGNDEGVKYTLWNDDPDDAAVEGFPSWIGEPHAIEWIILPLAPDPNHGMAINTRQYSKRYAQGERYNRLLADPPHSATIRPWTDFIPPAESITRHGVWLDNDKFVEHVNRAPQAQWGWMHWCEHLPEGETEVETSILMDGQSVPLGKSRRKLKEQREQGRYFQAEHTITYYQRDTNRAVGWATSTHEDALETTTAGAATESVTLNGSDVDAWCFTTGANQPNSADWPSGTYHAQINITAISAGVIVWLPFYSGSVNLARVDSTMATVLEEIGTPLTTISGTGLKLWTGSGINFAAGSASDVLSFAVLGRGSAHGDAMTPQLNTTDSYADGPWTAEEPASPSWDNQDLIITS